MTGLSLTWRSPCLLGEDGSIGLSITDYNKIPSESKFGTELRAMASASCTLFCSVSHFPLILLISMLIQYSECCPRGNLFNFSCPDNVYNGPFSTSQFTSPSLKNYNCLGGPCELTCDYANMSMIKCTKSHPPYRVLEINPTNLTITIAAGYPDPWMSKLLPSEVYSYLNFSFPNFKSVSLSITGSGENQTFLGCPFPSGEYVDDFWDAKFSGLGNKLHGVIAYGPYEYGLPLGKPPPPPGCMTFQTCYSPYDTNVNDTKEPAFPTKKRKEPASTPSSKTGITWAHILSVIVIATAALIVIIIYWRRRSSKPGLRPLSSSIMSLVHTRSDVEEGSTNNGITVFSYAELQEVTNDFDPARELGEGGFGVVYHGKLNDGREVAVKRMFEKNYRQIEQFKNEIQLLTNVRHPNLVTLYGSTSRHSRELLLVYEYIPNGTLSDHLHGRQSKSALLLWPTRLNIAIQTASALCYLHFKDIIHRDVKSNNILLDKTFVAKVADFGLSRLFPSDVSHVSTAPQGTPGYLDPEYHQCYHLTDRSDVYSFGVVLVELISSREAVDFERERHEVNLANYAMNRIQGCEFGELVDVNLGYDKSFKVRRMTNLVAELAFRCLQHEREIRPSMEEVLEELKRIESVDYEDLEAEEMG